MLSWQMPLNKCGRKDGNIWIKVLHYSRLKEKQIFHRLLFLFLLVHLLACNNQYLLSLSGIMKFS